MMFPTTLPLGEIERYATEYANRAIETTNAVLTGVQTYFESPEGKLLVEKASYVSGFIFMLYCELSWGLVGGVIGAKWAKEINPACDQIKQLYNDASSLQKAAAIALGIFLVIQNPGIGSLIVGAAISAKLFVQ